MYIHCSKKKEFEKHCSNMRAFAKSLLFLFESIDHLEEWGERKREELAEGETPAA